MALLQITEPGQSVDPHQRKRAAGIDLGTTNSLIASVRGGRTETLPDHSGDHLLPSVVRYTEQGVEVGEVALAAAESDPLNTITSVKRMMGRGHEDLSETSARLPYEFLAGEGMVRLSTVAGEVSPVEVSAEILKHLVTRGSESLAGELDGVVITVPAYFDDAQRQATRDAARLAGLNVLRLLNEPTAAAVAYGLDADPEQAEDSLIAVYDLGGGTFDISLLRLHQGIFEVVATGGDSALGGDDFDHRIADWILEQSDYSDSLSPGQQRALLSQSRQLKERLTDADSVEVALESGDLVFRGELSREQLNQLIEELVQRSIMACRRTLRDAGTPTVDRVVLVGGSTRVPLVRQAVSDFFGVPPLGDIDPDRVVAMGAAIQANILVGNKPEDEMLLLDVLPLSLGLETVGGLVERIIQRNTAIPVAKSQEFTTFKDGQSAMLIHVLQGEREKVTDCRSLARFELHDIPPMVAGAAKIEVTFQVDADGLLSVAAREKSTGVAAGVEVKPSYGLSEEEITRMLKASFEHAEQDVALRSLMEARVDAERVVDALENALAADGEKLLDPEQVTVLLEAAGKLRELMKGEDTAEITRGTELIGQASEEFASLRMDAAVHRALAGHRLEELEQDIQK